MTTDPSTYSQHRLRTVKWWGKNGQYFGPQHTMLLSMPCPTPSHTTTYLLALMAADLVAPSLLIPKPPGPSMCLPQSH